MTGEYSIGARLARIGTVVTLGLSAGFLMILSSNTFSPFSPVALGPIHLYIFIVLTGIIIGYLYREMSHMALSASGATILAAFSLTVALALEINAVGWAISPELLLNMVGIQVLTYAVTMIILQAVGVFVVLLLRGS
ncbi:MAG: hypothetical protein ACOCVQ_04275 [Bacillota bacterium]